MERAVADLPGVIRARLNFGAAKLHVEGSVSPAVVMRETSLAGVTARPAWESGRSLPFWQTHRRALVTATAGILLMAGWIAAQTGYQVTLVTGLYLAAILVGGASTARKGVRSLPRLRFDMNVLMTVAILGAAAIGEWAEGAVVAFLFSLSESLESYTMERARHSLRSLLDLAPRTALVRRGGAEVALPVEQVRTGEVLVVKPGDKIPLDGRVSAGGSAVNQAPITGESRPVEKAPGDEVFAGSINYHGTLEVGVTREAHDTTLARIVHLVEEAQAQKAPAQHFVDRFSQYYTPAVIGLAGAMALLPPLLLGAPWHEWIYRGLALLVVACPCALIVSTPVTIVAAISTAARHGVLVKGGAYLETVGRIRHVAFDKTGTLTRGEPEVVEVVPAPGVSADELLQVAALLEGRSEHPLGLAIRRRVSADRGGDEISDFQALPGRGVRARINGGEEVWAGSPRLLREAGIVTGALDADMERLQDAGLSIVLVGSRSKLYGAVGVGDTLRSEAYAAITGLRAHGVTGVHLLTGDNHRTAEAVARTVGVNAVLAERLPEDKVAAIRDIARRSGPVAMVGDGVNDAPALAAASVGMAMGGAGSDASLETADIVLMSDDLSKLPFVIGLGRRALRIIKQNIGFSLALKAAAILLVFPGVLTLWLAILADMGATLLVTLNGMRLLLVRPEDQSPPVHPLTPFSN